MAERTSSRTRQRRSEARDQRRSLAAEPFEQLDETARAEGESSRGPALKQAAVTAVAGAVAAGLAGAAKALLDRRGDENEASSEPSGRNDRGGEEQEREEQEREEPDERQSQEEGEQPQAETETEPGPDDEESTGDAAESAERNQEPSDDPEAASGAPEAEAEQAEADQAEPDRDRQPQPSGDAGEPQSGEDQSGEDESDRVPQGASAKDAKKIIGQARQELQELLGAEPESVSGFERGDHRWTVMLEVVDVKRVPDSTDVLSSYELTYDDDGQLVSVAQRRRYRRSQVEEG